jgi:hypothetical protein
MPDLGNVVGSERPFPTGWVEAIEGVPGRVAPFSGGERRALLRSGVVSPFGEGSP